MALRLITPPAAEPVSLEEIKAHLRVEHDDDDSMIALYAAAARQWIDGPQGWLGRTLMPQTWDVLFDGFPAGDIALPLTPVQSIDSVTYDDADGVEQTADAEGYYLDNTSEPAWLIPAESGWGVTALDAANSVRIRVVAGYASADDVPAPIKAAILLMTGALYNQREEVSEGRSLQKLPFGVDSLLSPYRVWL